MRKPIALLLLFLLLLSAAACGNGTQHALKASNDILTYETVEPQKTTLVVTNTGNTNIRSLTDAFEAKHPDVQIVTLDLTGGDRITRPVVQWIENGKPADIAFVPPGFFTAEQTVACFENLSANEVIAAYEAESLNRVAVDSHIYFLPGPSQIDCMIYNKTLFEQYGWKIPQTFDEFVTLCGQIRADTDGAVQPWNPNAKYSNEFLKVTEGFVYAELFGGVDNRTWYHGFCAGERTFSGHMEPYYRMLQTLIDHDLLREEHFTYSATTRGKEFAAGQIAMYNYTVSHIDSSDYEFDLMPFPSTSGSDGYICSDISVLIGVTKRERSAKQQEAVQQFLSFLSSAEGQQAFIGDLLMVSSVQNVPFGHSEYLESIEPVVNSGRLFKMLDFSGASRKANFSLCGDALAMLRGERTAAECIAAADRAPFRAADESETPPEVIAAAAEDFTMLETSELLADLYRETAGAEIGLINHGVAYRGNLMFLFAGDITASAVTVLKPRSLANDSKLLRVTMTGQALLDCLNHPLGNEKTSDSIYAFSGLKCRIAPWKPLGKKLLSVTLADGTPIDPGRTYTVALWEGTADERYITRVEQAFAGTFEEIAAAYLRQKGTVSPARDGRSTLVWN